MKYYVQLMIILLFSLVGEIVSTTFHLPVPGFIIGLLLLFLALQFKIIRLHHIHDVGQFLLANMTILFLPAAVGAAVGIMERYSQIAPNIIPILLITLGALVINIVIIAIVVSIVKKRFEGDYMEVKK